jgi:cyanophycinase-like exopeptidase
VADVLERGGAIGGSSAAARLQGDGVICRKPGEADQALMAEASECGLGLLSGMVIDDHSDPEPPVTSMATALRERFPNCVGVSLKSDCAVVVRGHTLQVVGSTPVSVMGSIPQPDDENATMDLVQVGQMYDLRARRVMSTEPVADEVETQ